MSDLRSVRPARSILAAAFASCVLSLALTAPADAYIYWVDKVKGTHTIGRAELDGSNVNRSFITDIFPGEIAVGPNHVYWTPCCVAPAIGRANLDGTGVNETFITLAQPPAGVAADGRHVYWTSVRAIGPGAISRADLDGSNVNQSFITTATPPFGVAVDGRHVYWTGAGTIGRANLDGTGVKDGFITTGLDHYPRSLAVDPGHIYWTQYLPGGTYTIGRADLDGTDVNENFIPGAISPFDIAVDADHVYWAYNGRPDSIGRADLDGSNVNQSFLTGGRYGAIAVDALGDTSAPQTRLTKGAPNRTKKTKLKFKFKSSEPESTFECKLDKKKWKPCESPLKVKGLDEGAHKFKVRAINAAGNVDPSPAKDKFKVVG